MSVGQSMDTPSLVEGVSYKSQESWPAAPPLIYKRITNVRSPQPDYNLRSAHHIPPPERSSLMDYTKKARDPLVFDEDYIPEVSRTSESHWKRGKRSLFRPDSK